MTDGPLLDAALLSELEQRLRATGAPAAEAARPGLSEEAIEATIAALGIPLAHEAVVWWSWHDGVARDAGDAAREIGPRRHWLPLQEAVEERARALTMTARAWPDDPAESRARWSPTWMPIIAFEALVVIDTGTGPQAPCPVRVHWFDQRPGPPHLPSLRCLVALWIDALDHGAWRYDRDRGRWITDPRKLDRNVAHVALA